MKRWGNAGKGRARSESTPYLGSGILLTTFRLVLTLFAAFDDFAH